MPVEFNETLCTRCANQPICKIVPEFMKIQESVNNINSRNDIFKIAADCRYYKVARPTEGENLNAD